MDIGTEIPRTSIPIPQATRATPLSARAVADGAMDLTPSVPRRTSVPGRGIPRSPPGGPRRTRPGSSDSRVSIGPVLRCSDLEQRAGGSLRASAPSPRRPGCAAADWLIARCERPGLISRSSGSDQVSYWRPRQDSNLRSRLRRAVLYPLSYGGPASGPRRTVSVVDGPHRTVDAAPASGLGHLHAGSHIRSRGRRVRDGAGCRRGVTSGRDRAGATCVRMPPGSHIRSAGTTATPRSRWWPHPSEHSPL